MVMSFVLPRPFPLLRQGGPGEKRGTALTGDAQAPGAKAVRSVNLSSADGWPLARAARLDGHGDRAEAAQSWAHGTTAKWRKGGHPCLHAAGAATPSRPLSPAAPERGPGHPPSHARPRRPRPPWIPQQESGLHRRVLGHAEWHGCAAPRHRVAAALSPRKPSRPRRLQEPPRDKACPRRGGPRPRPLKGFVLALHPGMLCLSNQALSRPTGRNLGEESHGLLVSTCSWPVLHPFSRLRLSVSLSRPGCPSLAPHDCVPPAASINGNSLHGCGRGAAGTRRVCSACVAGHRASPGPAPPSPPARVPNRTLPLPSVKGPHSQGYLDRCFCLERLPVGSGVESAWIAGRPSPRAGCVARGMGRQKGI